MGIRAVTFDYWNTLIAETDAPLTLRRSLWVDALVEAGHPAPDDEELTRVFREAWEEFDRRWRRNETTAPAEVAAHAVDRLGFAVGERTRSALIEAYIAASTTVPRELVPDVAETFERLASLDIAIGVVCDVGIVDSKQLRRWLGELGVIDHIAHLSFSDEVGVFKPDPRIFQDVLRGLGGHAPAHAAHVGDLRRTDVAGARGMGMVSVRFTGCRDDLDESDAEADHVIAAHPELFEVLGLD